MVRNDEYVACGFNIFNARRRCGRAWRGVLDNDEKEEKRWRVHQLRALCSSGTFLVACNASPRNNKVAFLPLSGLIQGEAKITGTPGIKVFNNFSEIKNFKLSN